MSWLGSTLGLGLIVLLFWLIKRDSSRAVEAALDKLDADLTRAREDSLARVEKEFDEEDKRMDSTRPAHKFDWLFEDHHTD